MGKYQQSITDASASKLYIKLILYAQPSGIKPPSSASAAASCTYEDI